MATLELAIDATKAQQGAQVAQQAFVQVQKAAEGASQAAAKTGQAVADSGAKMNAAFQATGGSIQIAGGIAQTAKAFGELNIQAGLFNSSRLLLEIGKTASDFRELASGVTGVSGAFGTLSAIVKANPLLAAATAIGAIATALSLFTKETKEATSAYKGFGDALRQSLVERQVAELLGEAGPGAQSQAAALRRGLAQTYAAPSINIREQFQGTAIEREIAQRVLALYPYQQPTTVRAAAGESMTARGQLESYLRIGEYQRPKGRLTEYVAGLPELEVPSEKIRSILADIYRESQKQLEAEKQATVARQQIAEQLQAQLVQFGAERPQPGALGGFEMRSYQAPYFLQRPTIAPGTYMFGAGPEVQTRMPTVGFPTGPYVGAEYQYSGGRLRPEYQVTPGQAPPLLQRPQGVIGMGEMGGMAGRGLDMVTQSLEQSVLLAAEIAKYKKQEAEAAKRVEKNLERAADYAGQVGGSLGAAFADVLMKTTTLRQAFASIVASFARQGLADIGTAIFRGAVNGLTPTQAQGNVGMRTPGGP